MRRAPSPVCWTAFYARSSETPRQAPADGTPPAADDRAMHELPFYRRPSVTSLALIAFIAVSAIGIRGWLLTGDRQSTDKAFIEAHAEAGALLVVANFKRTQLPGVRPGQSAMITVREYPDQVLRGHVDTIDERARARAPGP